MPGRALEVDKVGHAEIGCRARHAARGIPICVWVQGPEAPEKGNVTK